MDMSVDLAPTTAASNLLDIFFWVLNESKSLNSIRIQPTETVDNLRDAVMKKKPKIFADVESDELILWKVRRLWRSWSFLQLSNLDSLTHQSS
jgi:hypothetical protein